MSKRPLGAEDHKIAEWTQKLGDHKPSPHLSPEHVAMQRESFFVGCWLEERLRERNASEQDIYDTCMSSGQICFGRQPWIVARIMLADYDEGVKYKPGGELARRLWNGSLSEHFGPGGEARTLGEMMRRMGVKSEADLLKRFGATSLEELKEKLLKRLAAEEADMQRPR